MRKLLEQIGIGGGTTVATTAAVDVVVVAVAAAAGDTVLARRYDYRCARTYSSS